ncbi:MAG TPA: carboxypeptidase regulatory-like domain-containing protein, partial [Flavobacteriales bacterium]|nr:carboxypeptidase regulatory-like domain-containing protein [Flavobacteriales bacterium]HRP83062.1 carboxypeptidase regulatory-like domain-containing protein [Flavobacteriales bacterium]
MTGFDAFAQSYTQTVRGIVQDADTREALIGAVVAVSGTEPRIAATTDLDGRFTLANVPVGRIDVEVRMMGYDDLRLNN